MFSYSSNIWLTAREVAKHYTTSRSSFNETALYWTEIYAGGPKGTRPEEKKDGTDEIAIAGLERAHVEQFESLGFDRVKVVRTQMIFV